MKKNKKNKGFTLFELLVSISIIGILTALASVAFSGAQKKARDARRMQDMKVIQTAAEQYYSVNIYVYPTSTGVAWTGSGSQSILDKYPIDPKNDDVNGYVYTQPTFTSSAYCHCAKMENAANANSGANCDFTTPTDLFCVKNQQ
jgi:prepilin-type N-terminal cleavage/methylation domain-containing protein